MARRCSRLGGRLADSGQRQRVRAGEGTAERPVKTFVPERKRVIHDTPIRYRGLFDDLGSGVTLGRPEEQLRLVVVVRAAAQRDVVDGRLATGRVRSDIWNSTKARSPHLRPFVPTKAQRPRSRMYTARLTSAGMFRESSAWPWLARGSRVTAYYASGQTRDFGHELAIGEAGWDCGVHRSTSHVRAPSRSRKASIYSCSQTSIVLIT